MDDRSKVLKFGGVPWGGGAPREDKTGEGPDPDGTPPTLLGGKTRREAVRFLPRYFEIPTRGYSTLERHQHPHAVVVIRGRGRVMLGDRSCDIAPFDCVYVSPGVAHQFRATGTEPLGFLCTVDRMRDRPEVVG